MKWIGRRKEKHELYGMIDIEVIIVKNGEFYDIKVFNIYPNEERHKNWEYGNTAKYSKSLGGAKRHINQDTDLKAKDWDWEVIED